MAQLTISGLKQAAADYVVATKQLQTTFTPTVDDFTKTVCKIGKMFTVYMPITDKLPELSADQLNFGQTVEEYFCKTFIADKFTYADGSPKRNAKRATFAEAVYSYPLDEQIFELGVPRTQFQRVSLGQQSFSNLVADTISTLDSGYNAWQYAAKRQLLGNMATEAAKNSKLVTAMTKPTDTATGEKFIKKVKELGEIANDMNDHNLAGEVAAAAPALKLYVKQGVIPSLETDVEAGCFQLGKLAMPAEIKTVLDFGNADESIYAILVDPRGIKLHDDVNIVTTDYDGYMNQDNFWRHLQSTGVLSRYSYVHVFKNA